MAVSEFREKWGKAAVGAAMIGLTIALPNAGNADGNNAHITPAATTVALQEQSDIHLATKQEIGEAALQAAEHGYSGTGVGVAIYIGRDLQNEGKPLSYYEQGFENLLSKEGVPSEQFAVFTSAKGSSFEFHTQGKEFGPMGLGEAMETIPTIAEDFKTGQRAHQLLSLNKTLN